MRRIFSQQIWYGRRRHILTTNVFNLCVLIGLAATALQLKLDVKRSQPTGASALGL